MFFFMFDEETGETASVPVKENEFSNNDELEFIYDDTIRKVCHAQEEEWYFSIVDVCQVLTDSSDPQTYWRVLKKRLKDEGNETVTNCNAFKMKASDGKMRLTDCANTEQLLCSFSLTPPNLSVNKKLNFVKLSIYNMIANMLLLVHGGICL